MDFLWFTGTLFFAARDAADVLLAGSSVMYAMSRCFSSDFPRAPSSLAYMMILSVDICFCCVFI